MKSLTSLLLLGCYIKIASSLVAQDPARVALIDETFEYPSGTSISYPPGEGVQWEEHVNGFAGSTKKGSAIELTYSGGYGAGRTGGIRAVVKEPIIEFMQVSFTRLQVPMINNNLGLMKPLRSFELDLDAKLPPGKSLSVVFCMSVTKDFEKAMGEGLETWRFPLAFGLITGTGEYQHYKLSGADLNDKAVLSFINYIRDLYLNGLTESQGELTLRLDKNTWEANDEFWLDNVKLTILSK